MQLWTDYEGVTIDNAYTLQKLLMPEGRSAFYSTAGPNGEPTVVRLIECHFDEEEILSRWRCVAALNHPNFLKFEHFGQTEIDGRPVVYAVLEKVDANLAEVLDQGTLPVKDVAQLASSLVAALEVLHTNGFIHEHVQPRNIFALNDVVKLRSDCIREAPEGDEGRAAKQRDVHDLTTVLLQALTQRESIEGIPDSAMPAPFHRIIRKGLDGTWNLENIRAALEGSFAPKPAVVPNWVATAPPATVVPDQKIPDTPAPAPSPQQVQLPLPLLSERLNLRSARTNPLNDQPSDRSQSPNSRWLGIAAVATTLLILLAWIIAHTSNSHRPEASQAPAVSQPAPLPLSQLPNPPAQKPTADDLPRQARTAATASHPGWRVIAFTYNRRADADLKASEIARNHPALEPEVFAPSGRAPFYISIDGVMDQRTAHSLAQRARALSLPRDTFARYYSR